MVGFLSLFGMMEEEMQELRELVAQLRADNAKLRQECTQVVSPGPSNDSNLPGLSVVKLFRL